MARLEWYSWLLRSLHIIIISFAFSLSKRRDIIIEFAKGPRFDSAFEYTHAHTFSFFLCVCAYSAARGLRGEAETKVFFLKKETIFCERDFKKKSLSAKDEDEDEDKHHEQQQQQRRRTVRASIAAPSDNLPRVAL